MLTVCFQVESIDYSIPGKVRVTTKHGRTTIVDKVIVAVPLTVLKRNSICFTPCLPSTKRRAIRRLGAGLVEKVALWFPTRFWEKKIKPNQDYFGHIPQSQEQRGLFNIFYIINPVSSLFDFVYIGCGQTRMFSIQTSVRSKSSSKKLKLSGSSAVSTQESELNLECVDGVSEENESELGPQREREGVATEGGVLLTVVTGESVERMNKMKDVQVAREAHMTLVKLFPEQVGSSLHVSDNIYL